MYYVLSRFNNVPPFMTLRAITCWAPLSMRFSWQDVLYLLAKEHFISWKQEFVNDYSCVFKGILCWLAEQSEVKITVYMNTRVINFTSVTGIVTILSNTNIYEGCWGNRLWRLEEFNLMDWLQDSNIKVNQKLLVLFNFIYMILPCGPQYP